MISQVKFETPEDTFFHPKFIKLCQNVLKSRSRLKLGHAESKPRSLGQTLEKPCVFSRWYSFDPTFMNLCVMLILIISRSDLKLGHIVSQIGCLSKL